MEILRGPQGTFVGQNATGGAVFVTSQDPVINGGHDGYFQAQAGNYNDVRRAGRDQSTGRRHLRCAHRIQRRQRDSFYDITGPYTGDDGVKTGSVRLGMLWEPSEHLSML